MTVIRASYADFMPLFMVIIQPLNEITALLCIIDAQNAKNSI